MRQRCGVLLFIMAIFTVACSAQSATQISPSATSPTPTLTVRMISSLTKTPSGPSLTPSDTYVYPVFYTRTPTPTLDFPVLANYYLTPFTPIPLSTPNPHAATPRPTPTNIDVLKQIRAQKLPQNWTPTPLPPVTRDGFDLYGFIGPRQASWQTPYIQALTDLMNFTNADKTSILKYIERGNDHWNSTLFSKNDFDHDGQYEWLIGIPVSTPDCCLRLMIVFEKVGSLYQPIYYKALGDFHMNWQLLQVADLNKDGYLDVVTGVTNCGSACSTHIYIGAWDGQRWREYDTIFVPTSNPDYQTSFSDVDNNGTTEILLQYRTWYKLDQSYPERKGIDTYTWKNGQYQLQKTWLQPNVTPYAVLRDVYSALEAGNASEALRLAQPALDNLAQSCASIDSYTAIEVMLAHAIRNEPEKMEATLSLIMTSCNHPNNETKNQIKNGFVPAANILWLAYQKTHSALLACQAMQRFIQDQRRLGDKTHQPAFSFEAAGLTYNSGKFCPLK